MEIHLQNNSAERKSASSSCQTQRQTLTDCQRKYLPSLPLLPQEQLCLL